VRSRSHQDGAQQPYGPPPAVLFNPNSFWWVHARALLNITNIKKNIKKIKNALLPIYFKIVGLVYKW
jgi:hypothetical protein